MNAECFTPCCFTFHTSASVFITTTVAFLRSHIHPIHKPLPYVHINSISRDMLHLHLGPINSCELRFAGCTYPLVVCKTTTTTYTYTPPRLVSRAHAQMSCACVAHGIDLPIYKFKLYCVRTYAHSGGVIIPPGTNPVYPPSPTYRPFWESDFLNVVA